jgi:hypothetical protein
MPCYATGSAEGDARLAASEARSEYTKTARLLCQACEIIERKSSGWPVNAPKELTAWWENHKKIDAARRKRERRERQQRINGKSLRKSAMEKLTEEEKIELFGGQSS